MTGNPRIADDTRLDPRIRAVFTRLKLAHDPFDGIASRDDALAILSSPDALALREATVGLLAHVYPEGSHPEELTVSDHELVSQPDGNTVRVRVYTPPGEGPHPCVYYIHGGGMMVGSMLDGNYRAWCGTVAAEGVVVVAIDFRNSGQASSIDDIAPYPGGLNDCVSGLRWVHERADELGVDRSRVVVAGESGGGNLSIATTLRLKQDGDLGLVSGLYAMAPFLVGKYPHPDLPSTTEHNGKIIELHDHLALHAYGIEAYESRDPQAWPWFATVDDLRGLPRAVIRVNECDPLRDEGVEFYRRLLDAGVPARCDQIMGTVHAIEVMPMICPDITHAAARDLAGFATAAG